jgi:hypothetical protein
MTIRDPKTFLGNLKLSSKDLFQSRIDYKYLAVPYYSIRMLDFWYKDKNYGKVDTHGNAVYPLVNSTLVLEQIPENNSAVVAPFFITSPLVELKKRYARIIIDESVNALPAYDKFDVKRGIVDLDRLYSEHRSSLLNHFVFSYLQERQECIRNFKDIVREYKNFVKEYSSVQPVTKTSFIMLPRVTNAISGLILDLDFGNGNEDAVKKSFFEDRCGFVALQQAAARHGFFMDKNKPWRLVANVGSYRFLKHADLRAETGIGSQPFFDRYYLKAFEEDHFLVSNFIISAYSLFFANNSKINLDKKMLSGTIRSVTKQRFQPEVSPNTQKDLEYWMSLVFFTRMSELEIEENLVNKLSRDIIWSNSGDINQDFTQNLITINSIAKLYDPRIRTT